MITRKRLREQLGKALREHQGTPLSFFCVMQIEDLIDRGIVTSIFREDKNYPARDKLFLQLSELPTDTVARIEASLDCDTGTGFRAIIMSNWFEREPDKYRSKPSGPWTETAIWYDTKNRKTAKEATLVHRWANNLYSVTEYRGSDDQWVAEHKYTTETVYVSAFGYRHAVYAARTAEDQDSAEFDFSDDLP